MAKKILNKHNQVDVPTLILQNRNFDNLGTVVDISDLTYKENLNSANELSFTLYKSLDDKRNIIWNEIVTGKIIYLPEFQERFEITVSTTSENAVSKSITATSLCECELSQIKLYNIEINTESDITRDDYKVTVFYDPDTPSCSLIHRILNEKAPHYSIAHVDESLYHIQRMDLSFSDTDIYSLLTGDISEEFGCIFIFNSMDRSISVYDLYNTCHNCGYRGEFSEECPECKSTNFSGQYGNDTTVFISNENLATAITLEPDWNSFKNCFYIEGGDDQINAAIKLMNPNGTNYIYYMSEESKKDMPAELVSKIDTYTEDYHTYMTTTPFYLDKNVVNNYNKVVDYVNDKFADDETINYSKLNSTITGYSSITTAVYDAIDLYQFVANSMMPTINTKHMSLSESLDNIVNGFAKGFTPTNGTETFANKIALLNSTSALQEYVEKEILKTAKLFYSTAHYKLDVSTSSYTQATESTTGNWKGTFIITSLSEKNPNTGEYKSAERDGITLKISTEYELYLQQKIAKQIADKDTLKDKDITSLTMDEETFKNQLGFYSLSELESLSECFKSCMDVLSLVNSNGDANHQTLKDQYAQFYSNRLTLINGTDDPADIKGQKRIIQEYLGYIEAVYYIDTIGNTRGILNAIINTAHTQWNFEEYIKRVPENETSENYDSEGLWHTFCSYRREDKYTNSNIISDGSTNKKIMEDIQRLLDSANRELYRAGTLQYSISTTMNNLLALPEFHPIMDYFDVGNWIRIGMEDKVYKLRLLSYQISFDEIQEINVEFSTVTKITNGVSDIKSILNSAQSMVTSYNGIKTLTANNTEKSKYVSTWISDGFNLTNQKIVSNANNQSITIDEHGILAQTYNDEGLVDDHQLKIFNSGLYLTDNNWTTTKTGIGKFIYLDPKADFKETVGYGVIADTIVSDIVLSEELGIYNSNGNMCFNNNGLVIKNNKTGEAKNTFIVNINDNDNLLKIVKGDGDTAETVFCTDSDGNLTMTGTIHATEGSFSGSINGGNININNQFIVDTSGNFASSGNMNIANGNMTYDTTYGLYVKGNIQATGGIFTGNITSQATISGGKISGAQISGGKISGAQINGGNIISTNDIYTTEIKDGQIYSHVIHLKEPASDGLVPAIYLLSGDETKILNSISLSADRIDIDKGILNCPGIWTKSIDTNIINSGDITISNSVIKTPYTELYLKNDTYAVLLKTTDSDGVLSPTVTNKVRLGHSNYRWSGIYLSSPANVNSDRNLKENISPLSDKYVQFFYLLQPVSFLFKDGTSGRTHVGFISQDVEAAMTAVGLSDLDFAGFCKDIHMKEILNESGKIIGEEPLLDENGNVQYIYSLRYEEFISLITYVVQINSSKISDQTNEISLLKAENAELKSQIVSLQEQINTILNKLEAVG